MRFASLLLPLCLLTGLSGCAYFIDGSTETVQIKADNGAASIDDVQCTLDNKSGSWSVTAPGSVQVHRGSEPLDVKCAKDGFMPASEKVNAATNNDVYGNIILGGGIGATVDTVSGAAWEYPQDITVAMQPTPPSLSQPGAGTPAKPAAALAAQ